MDVALLGAGHIAHALAEGWRRPGLSPADRPSLIVYDIDAERAAAFAAALDATVAPSAAAAVEASQVVVVAVRPPDVDALLAQIAPVLGSRLLVSLAAYVDLARLGAGLPAGASVARLMPNVAAAVGRGVFLLARGTLDEADGDRVRRLFALSGVVVDLDEKLFDAGTALSGCGPGFAALFVEALAGGGVEAGLDPVLSIELAAGAAAGAAALIERDGDPAALRQAIAVPGGMTAAGLGVLETEDFAKAVRAAVQAAIVLARSKA